MINKLTDKYSSDTVHNADSGDLEGLELETLDFIIHREVLGVERLGYQSYIVDPCIAVNQFLPDQKKRESREDLHIRPTPLTGNRQYQHPLKCIW